MHYAAIFALDVIDGISMNVILGGLYDECPHKLLSHIKTPESAGAKQAYK